MTTLLILGSKPAPVLPPAACYEHLACANASGRSAADLGLPVPTYTVMSAILTSGKSAPNQLALTALRGLRTGTLCFYPRPAPHGPWLRRGLRRLQSIRTTATYFRWQLRAIGYHYDRFSAVSLDRYLDLVTDLCDRDPSISAQIRAKVPSSGLMALCLGLADGRYASLVMAGFSFEITHAYAQNPLIADRGPQSQHAATDIAVLSYLSRKYANVYTTEPVVHARAGVPLLSQPGDRRAAAACGAVG